MGGPDDVHRRHVLTLALGVLGALAGCSSTPSTPTGTPSTPSRTPTPAGPAPASGGPRFAAPTGIARAAVPHGTIYRLPAGGSGHDVALTVDDGVDSRVVRAYAEVAARTGLRLTMFVNGSMPSWTEHADLLRPLHDDGQAYLCNHTWSHPDLRTLSDARLAEEVQRNERFLDTTYGTLGRPFLRPPYGYRNARVAARLADLGYPTLTMWLGSFGDADRVPAQKVLDNAREWLLAEHIVIGHANHPGVIEVMDAIVALIHERGLRPVHLGDVYQV